MATPANGLPRPYQMRSGAKGNKNIRVRGDRHPEADEHTRGPSGGAGGLVPGLPETLAGPVTGHYCLDIDRLSLLRGPLVPCQAQFHGVTSIRYDDSYSVLVGGQRHRIDSAASGVEQRQLHLVTLLIWGEIILDQIDPQSYIRFG
jgi:hypothetical protein